MHFSPENRAPLEMLPLLQTLQLPSAFHTQKKALKSAQPDYLSLLR